MYMTSKRVNLVLLFCFALSSRNFAAEPEPQITLKVALQFNDTLIISGFSKLTKGDRLGFIFQDEFTRGLLSTLSGSALIDANGGFMQSIELPVNFSPGIYRVVARQYEGAFLNPTNKEGLFKLNNMMVRLNKMPEGSSTFLKGDNEDVLSQINQTKQEIQEYRSVTKDIQKLAKKINRGKKLGVYGLPNFMGIKDRVKRGKFLKELSDDQRKIKNNINVRGVVPLNENLSNQLFNMDMLVKSLDIEFASRGLERSRTRKNGLKNVETKLKQQRSEYNRSVKAIEKRIKDYGKSMTLINHDHDDGDRKTQALRNDYPLRTWHDSSGQFDVKAVFVKVEEGSVTIRRQNGKEISVPLLSLSNADQVYVRKLTAGDD